MQGRAGEKAAEKKKQLNWHAFILLREKISDSPRRSKAFKQSMVVSMAVYRRIIDILRREIGSIQAVYGRRNSFPWFHTPLYFLFQAITVRPPRSRSTGKEDIPLRLDLVVKESGIATGWLAGTMGKRVKRLNIVRGDY